LNKDFLPYGRQTIEDDDIQAVTAALKGDLLTTGPAVTAFEQKFSEITGAKETVVCGNGTLALHLACLAAGFGPGDVAIVPTLTFLATANAVRYCGADVIFADVDPETGLMGPDHLEEALSRAKGKNVKAVLPVHLAGQTVDQEAIAAVSRKHGLLVITDACHALGTTYKGTQVGSCVHEDLATFSFHPVKTIAMGEGGAITTNDTMKADHMRRLRHHAMVAKPWAGPWFHEVAELGYNYRASDIHCALGLSQLKKLDRFIARRRTLASSYDQLLEPLAPVIKAPNRVQDCNPAWHLYAARVDFTAVGLARADFMEVLKNQGIGTQVHYIPVHTQPYYRDLYGERDLPGARTYYERTLSLPLFSAMNDNDPARVVQAIKGLLGSGA
jgi:UDP-4-amino-4,6-dideoxy-N-acetyl-beta-L-altrosamine transaminase